MEITLPDKVFGIDSMLIKLFIQPIGIVIFLIMLFNLAVYPKINDTGRIRSEIARVEKEKKIVVDKINYINSIPQEELTKNASLLSAAMLYEKDAYYLVSVIRKIADKYNFIIQGFSLSPGKLVKDSTDDKTKQTVDGNKRVPVVLNMIGPKSSYLDFLLGLEKSLPILAIGKMDMKGRGAIVEIDLEVGAYYIDAANQPEVKQLSLNDLKLDKAELETLKNLTSYSNNREVITSEQEKVASRSGVNYGRPNPFAQ